MAQRVKKIKLFVLGLRGIPNVPGGVETHCQELYPRIVKNSDIEVTILGRKPYIGNKKYTYKGVNIVPIISPKKASYEAIIHSFISVIYAKIKGCNLLHIHAIGPSLVVPIAKILGLKVVVTHHGPDYERQKWGTIAKKILKLGERFAARYADKIIVISNVINNILCDKYNRNDNKLIFNGVNIPSKSTSTDYIEKLGLTKRKYIIAVGRFVEEKGFHDLIDAYLLITNPKYKLVLVGDSDHESSYSISLKEKARKNGIILTGYINGDILNQVFSHAKLFIMPSYHEGLPIALLEALSYDLNVIVSNIPANLEVCLTPNSYFETGNIEDLSLKISQNNEKINNNSKILVKYNWDEITIQTISLYKELLQYNV